MKTVEWVGNAWALVAWADVGHLTRTGRIVAHLKSKDKIDAECEAMLQGWM